MPIKVPAKRAYYYELTNLGERLTYWIPFKELEKLVKNKKVNKKVLTDYPGGLDIEVCKDSFEEFEKKYNFKFDISTKYIWQAFKKIYNEEIYKKDKKIPIPKTGYLDGKELESIAIKKSKTEIQQVRIPRLNTLSPSYSDNSKTKIPDTKLSSSKIKNLFNVKMTKGEEPFKVLSKLGKKQIKR